MQLLAARASARAADRIYSKSGARFSRKALIPSA